MMKYFLLLLLIFYPTVLLHAYSDLQALLDIKSSLLGPGGSGLHDWVPPQSPSDSTHCLFSGVTCDGDHRVTSLSVANVPLLGSIPPEIGLLDKLINLTLAADNLTGPLPLEISILTSLRHVNLSWNLLSGVFPGEMMLKFAEVEVFDVYNNNFTGTLQS